MCIRDSGRVEHADVNRRHTKDERRLEVEHDPRCRALVETIDQAHATAADQPTVETVAESVDMEERKHREIAVVLADLPHGRERDPIRGEIVVREHRALRDAGRSGRIDDHRRIVAIYSCLLYTSPSPRD